MGAGIDLAKDVSPAHAAAMENMRDQLLILLVQRLGGSVSVPVDELDSTGGSVLLMELDPHSRVFRFVVEKKQ